MWQRCLCFLALPAILILAVPADAQQAKGKKYALLVGVTDYDHSLFGQLKYTENDVERMAELLKGKTGGYDEVRLLTTTRGKKNKADAPTADNIKKALADLINGKKRHDTVVIALSGHGLTLEVEDPDGKGEPKSYVFFCPADADLLNVSYRNGTSKSLVNLSGVFNSLGKCGAGTKMVFVDACRNELKAESATRSIDPKSVTVPKGVGAMFSCGAGQQAREIADLKHGVFFYYLLDGLRGAAKNEDGEVTFGQLGDYVQRRVSREVPKRVGQGAKQSPHVMNNTEGEPPVLTRPGTAVVKKDGGKPKEKEPGEKIPGEPKGKDEVLPTSGGGYVFSAVRTGIEARKDGDLHWRAGPSSENATGAVRAFGHHDGRVYGYKGKVLFCLDERSGKEIWSRNVSLSGTGTITLSKKDEKYLRISDGTDAHEIQFATGLPRR